MAKKGIVALLACVFALSLALVGCSSGGGAASSGPTEADMKAAFAGEWELAGLLQDGKEAVSESELELMKNMGYNVTLTLKEDGTGSLDMYGEALEGKWTVSSMTEGTFTAEDETINMKLEDGKLSLSDDEEKEVIVFAKAEASSASSSASAAA